MKFLQAKVMDFSQRRGTPETRHFLDQKIIFQGGTDFYQLPNPPKMYAFVAHYTFVKYTSFCAFFGGGIQISSFPI